MNNKINAESMDTMFYVKMLEDRLLSKSAEMEKSFNKIFDRLEKIQVGQEELRLQDAKERMHTYEKIQEVKDKIIAVEKAATEKNHKLSLQVVAIASAIGMFGGGVGSEIMYRFRETVPIQDKSTIRIETTSPTNLQVPKTLENK